MNTQDDEYAKLALETVAGPTTVSLPLAGPQPLTIGRRSVHQLQLCDAGVSRDHALLRRTGKGYIAQATKACGSGTVDERGREQWLLCDTGSTHGTYLNGVRLLAERDYPVQGGDLISIGPWTLEVVDRSAPANALATLATLDDGVEEQSVVTRIDTPGTEALAQHRLQLLLKCSELIHSAPDEASLAQAVLDAAVSGSGYANAALLRPLRNDQTVEVVACRGKIMGRGAAVQLSRSLIREAASGSPARLLRQAAATSEEASIVELQIDEAMCVPIKLESAPTAFLYLDNRAGATGSLPARAAPDAGAFTIGLARLAALALANLKRLDIQRRQERMEVELQAAAEAQRMLLPSRRGCHGERVPHSSRSDGWGTESPTPSPTLRSESKDGAPAPAASGAPGGFSYIGESRPGRYVGGDFFDIVPLDKGRLAVALGDVAGKGVSASLLVTASQGFLHAALEQHGDPALAVTQLNRFYHSRLQDNSFMSLWVGLYDARTLTLSYVNAGHGYAYLYEPGAAVRTLAEGDTIVIGVLPDYVFEPQTVALPAAGRTLVVSDGVIEQLSPTTGGGEAKMIFAGPPRSASRACTSV